MSDAARLHHVILSHLLKLLPEMLEDNRLTLAMMITGLLRARNGQLKKIARAVSYAHKKRKSGRTVPPTGEKRPDRAPGRV